MRRSRLGRRARRHCLGRIRCRWRFEPAQDLLADGVGDGEASYEVHELASDRRATARQHKDDIDGRIIGYVKEHPQGTTGDMAKRLNADRGTIAAEVSNMAKAGELNKGREPHTLSERVTSAMHPPR